MEKIYELPENLEKLILSSNIGDVLLGFTLIKEKYGEDYFTSQMTKVGEGTTDKSSPYLYEGACNFNTAHVLIKIMDYKIVIHLLYSSFIFHTYRLEYSQMNYPTYGIFTVYEI